MGLLELLGIFFFYTLITFGNALVMFPIFNEILVAQRHVIDTQQLLYVFAVARVTPGLFNLYVPAIGYLTHGIVGAVLSVIVVSVPCFLVIPLVHGYKKVQHISFVRHFVTGLTAVSIGLIFTAIAQLGSTALNGAGPVIVFVTTIVMTRFLKWNNFLSFALGTVLGIILKLLL